MKRIKIVSSDLNGTLVHQNTMSDMIGLYVGRQQYQEAKAVFERRASGIASIEEAFKTAGPLTRGLTLRQAIEYTKTHLRYLDGFHEFVDMLSEQGVNLVINSTGYSVTIYAIREQIGAGKIRGHIANFLRFGVGADPDETLREDELERKVKEYFSNPASVNDPIYDQVKATGVIDLSIANEEAKAKLIREYAKRHFSGLKTSEIAHMGDTMGDGLGIFRIAEEGGIGIAFNYNSALKQYLDSLIRDKPVSGEIHFVDPKSDSSNLTRVLPILINK